MSLDDIRPIVVRSHISKIMEKALLQKIKDTCPHLIETKLYQTGFKEGKSTAIHASRLLHEVHGRNKRKFYMLIDLQKAYDSVDREILWKVLLDRCQEEDERQLVNQVIKLHRQSEIEIGGHRFEAEMGLPQGSILSPVLFNVYLEEALKTSDKLESVRKRGDLLAFADDMLVMSNSVSDLSDTIEALAELNIKWNLRLNKKKSEILTNEKLEQVNGVKCTQMVKYLGVRIVMNKKEQGKVAKEQIQKNVNLLRNRLKRADVDVLQQLTCCLARSLLIYIGTPMVAAGIWNKSDIDRLEAGQYRKIKGCNNSISNKAILNTMTTMKLAGVAVM
ncbi:MAG: RNA-directed DNA polymerase [Flavobacteriales bacterium]